MTPDQAIDLLDNLIGMIEDNHGSDYDEAIRMAIEALSCSERKKGKWISEHEGKWELHYCSECGWALMDTQGGEPPYMGIDFHRSNPERWTCCPGWNDWLMNYCPNCGADMRGEKNG